MRHRHPSRRIPNPLQSSPRKPPISLLDRTGFVVPVPSSGWPSRPTMNDQLIQRIRQCPTLPSLPAIAMQVLELAQKDRGRHRRDRPRHLQGPRPLLQDPAHRQLQLLRPEPEHQHHQPRPGHPRPPVGQDAGAGLLAGGQPDQTRPKGFQAPGLLAAQHLRRHRRPHPGRQDPARSSRRSASWRAC